jgi:excisionase family DNA binding protein
MDRESLQTAPASAPDPGALLSQLQLETTRIARDLGSSEATLDMFFLAYLEVTSRFGFFSFGPVTIDARLIEDIVYGSAVRTVTTPTERPGYSDDLVRFFGRLSQEAARSGRRRIDELTLLLAFMRTTEGLPGRVFGELGVRAEDVETFAQRRGAAVDRPRERLYSPEEAAEYLGVHVKTVRGWIRSGRLPASRLAGQRALRIRASDLDRVLEPVDSRDDSDPQTRPLKQE